jgi:hypothetical protein
MREAGEEWIAGLRGRDGVWVDVGDEMGWTPAESAEWRDGRFALRGRVKRGRLGKLRQTVVQKGREGVAKRLLHGNGNSNGSADPGERERPRPQVWASRPKCGLAADKRLTDLP